MLDEPVMVLFHTHFPFPALAIPDPSGPSNVKSLLESANIKFITGVNDHELELTLEDDAEDELELTDELLELNDELELDNELELELVELDELELKLLELDELDNELELNDELDRDDELELKLEDDEDIELELTLDELELELFE